MPSVREIAKIAGVSITTVSRVLNNHPNVRPGVREMVLSAANQSRYVPPVGRKTTNNIAFVYTSEPSLGSPFDAALLQGINQGLEEHNYDLLILEARRARQSGETFSGMLIRKGVRGAIIRTTSQSRAMCESIPDEGFPAVIVGDRFESPNIHFIYSDSRDASTDAIEHLIGLGHWRIAICVNVVDDSDHADRINGYRKALANHDIPFDDRLVLRVPAAAGAGSQIVKRVMTIPDRPTAVYITDPLACIGAISEARTAGLTVPGDLSIVGFDDGDLRQSVFPHFTAVCQDAEALGRHAFSILNQVMAAGNTAQVRQAPLKCWFEVHHTTGEPTKK